MPKGVAQKYAAKDVADAIRASQGLKGLAAKRLGMSPRTLNRYIKAYENCQQALEESTEYMTDLAEHRLFEHINNGSLPAIMFYLRTKGHSRGYNERFDLGAFLHEKAEEIAAARGLDRTLVLQQADRILIEGRLAAGG